MIWSATMMLDLRHWHLLETVRRNDSLSTPQPFFFSDETPKSLRQSSDDHGSTSHQAWKQQDLQASWVSREGNLRRFLSAWYDQLESKATDSGSAMDKEMARSRLIYVRYSLLLQHPTVYHYHHHHSTRQFRSMSAPLLDWKALVNGRTFSNRTDIRCRSSHSHTAFARSLDDS